MERADAIGSSALSEPAARGLFFIATDRHVPTAWPSVSKVGPANAASAAMEKDMSNIKEAGLTMVRLHARHTGDPLTRELIDEYLEGFFASETDIAAAYAQGLSDRAAGHRCLCPLCEIDANRLGDRERLRGQYARGRARELRATGVSEERIDIQIDAEIRAGAALHGSSRT